MTTSEAVDSPGVIALPPFLYGGTFAVVMGLYMLWPLPILRQDVALWLGLPFIALGATVAYLGRRAMVTAGTNVNPTKPTLVLVNSGPFRYSRNPLYVALTLLYLGVTLAVNTWWGLVAMAPLLLVVHHGVVLREERYLERKFGDNYRAYCSTVRRYF